MQQLANCYRLLKTLACANLLAMCTHFFFFFFTPPQVLITQFMSLFIYYYISLHIHASLRFGQWCGSRTVDKNHADTSHELQVMFTSNI